MKKAIRIICFVIMLSLIKLSISDAIILHNLTVFVHPKEHKIIATDYIVFPKNFKNKRLNFVLSPTLTPKLLSKDAKLKLIFKSTANNLAPDIYELSLMNSNTVTIKYSGIIYHPLLGINGPYEMGMKTTSGIIFKKGIYLDPFGLWYPFFNIGDIRFSLEIYMPKDWKAITQGKRLWIKDKGNIHIEKWICNNPQKGIYLYGAKLFEYDLSKKEPHIYVFLREKSPYLAKTYLKAARCYINFYSRLIGKYPYPKFALVENFWETGYAMPSFTLIGPMVLRLPFIIYSSFPHEILHNWWGNSVYVNYKQGNWCEGLTAYLSDYLIQEELGGENPIIYRRSLLQKYSAFIKNNNDFPLKDFIERNNEAQEAIGYGKSLMMFHMLRVLLGNNTFKSCIRAFYKEYKFKSASFSDIERSFSKTSKQNLKWFFNQWVNQKGAPILTLRAVTLHKLKDKFILTLDITQLQNRPIFKLHIPIIITLRGEKNAIRKWIWLSSKNNKFYFLLKKEPLRLDIDPFYQVFRRLLPDQAPSSLYEMFAAKKIVIILPSRSPFYLKRAYNKLANIWMQSDKSIKVILDNNLTKRLKELKPDAIWIFGIKNKALLYFPKLRKIIIENRYKINSTSILTNKLTVVVCKNTLLHGKITAVSLVASYNPNAIVSLAPRLIHYGRYSFLIFKGRYARCILRGSFKIKIPNSLCWIKDNKVPLGKIDNIPKPLCDKKHIIRCFNIQKRYF